ncbi:MAG: penicillin acylase family protein, partial [Myxococcales bacterium]|nr:penicillin acylase family protein [Myxococcales bacterium]
TEVSRTLYRTHYGPVINVLGFGWNETLAATYRDTNLNNDKLIPMVLEMNRAGSMQEFQGALASTKGMPWAHTMSADDQGQAWYIDASATANLRPETVASWVESIKQAGIPRLVYEEAGVMLLDGSDPLNEWVEEPGAREPGLIPHDRLPQLSRADFVFNANDSHWLTNPAAPLEGYPATHGFERVPQSVRSRTNLDILTGPAFAGADGKFTLDELGDAVLGNTSIATGLLLDDVIARCQGEDVVALDNETYSIAAACGALAGWDGRADLDSPGALVWREFMGSYSEANHEDKGALFSVAFDPDAPVATPNTLAPAPEEGTDDVLRHLAMSVRSLGEAKLAVDATLRDTQYTLLLGGERFPIHGAAHSEGVMNQVFDSVLQTSSEPQPKRAEVINPSTDLTRDGYMVTYGSSFIMAMEFTDDGPRAKAILTYGQSEDPGAPDYGRETQAYAAKQWRAVRFTEADISADPALVTQTVSGG